MINLIDKERINIQDTFKDSLSKEADSSEA